MATLLYNPDRKNKEQFLEEFVIRTDIFDELFEDIKTSKMKHPEQHYLLVGQRGTGKTTMLTRIKYAIEDDKALNRWLLPVSFSEEQYNISELTNLWERIAEYLEDYHGFTDISKEIEVQSSRKDFEETAFRILIKHLDIHKKKLVLLIDNIGDMLDKFEELEVRRFREILQTSPHIRLIAGSAVFLESLTDYLQPLFEFLKIIQFKGLNYEESITLLKKLGEVHGQIEKIENVIQKTPGRIETLRTLSAGVPRTIALLFQVLIDNEHGTALSDLEEVLDRVTPLYKHRMDDLPPQQQKIVDAVAKKWDAISVKELKENVRLESKAISAQLRQLEKNQVIEIISTKTKNNIYVLKERFFNIWYLMRHGRKKDREKVIWLVKFLEMWCDENEIEERIKNYIVKVQQGLLDSHSSEVYGEVYSFFNKITPETKLLLKQATPEYISNFIEISNRDFEDLADRYIDSEDWKKLVELAITRETITVEQKNKIFKPLNPFQKTSADYRKIIASFYNDEIGVVFNSDESVVIPHFYFTAEIKVYENIAAEIISINDVERIDKSVKSILSALEFAKENIGIGRYELRICESFITSLLMFKYYNKALDFFDEVTKLEPSFMDIYKSVYYALLKLTNPKTISPNPELDKSASKVIQSIKSVHKRMEMLAKPK